MILQSNLDPDNIPKIKAEKTGWNHNYDFHPAFVPKIISDFL